MQIISRVREINLYSYNFQKNKKKYGSIKKKLYNRLYLTECTNEEWYRFRSINFALSLAFVYPERKLIVLLITYYYGLSWIRLNFTQALQRLNSLKIVIKLDGYWWVLCTFESLINQCSQTWETFVTDHGHR